MYQLAWTRRLITVTSATASTQALVLSLFIGGLGLGSWVGGRLATRARRPILGYVLAEAIAATLALLSIT